MHTSALVLNAERLPSLGFGYRRDAHAAEMQMERVETRQPTTPVRPLKTAQERSLLAAERARIQGVRAEITTRRRAQARD